MYTTTDTLLKDAKKTNQNLDKHFKASNHALDLLNQIKNKIDKCDFNVMRDLSAEIVRDSKILKRRITLLTKKINEYDSNRQNEELNDEFLSILNQAKEYNSKWSTFYVDIYK